MAADGRGGAPDRQHQAAVQVAAVRWLPFLTLGHRAAVPAQKAWRQVFGAKAADRWHARDRLAAADIGVANSLPAPVRGQSGASAKTYSAAFIWKPSSILSEGATG